MIGLAFMARTGRNIPLFRALSKLSREIQPPRIVSVSRQHSCEHGLSVLLATALKPVLECFSSNLMTPGRNAAWAARQKSDAGMLSRGFVVVAGRDVGWTPEWRDLKNFSSSGRPAKWRRNAVATRPVMASAERCGLPCSLGCHAGNQ